MATQWQGEYRSDEWGPDASAGEPTPPPLSERERCLAAVRKVLLGEPRPHSLEAAALAIEEELSRGGE